MKNIKDVCIDFLKNENIKTAFMDIFSPICNIIYDKIYLYIWVISIYMVFLTCIILANLFLLLRIIKSLSKKDIYISSQ